MVSFYPPINENLFIKAIRFAKQMTEKSDEDINLIKQARKTLFNEGIPWVKKEGNEDFDVTMGCFNEAKVCELARTYIYGN